MATKYWVGGAGTWDSSTNWSTSSGGSRNTSPPGAGDLAVFDANSGSGTVYLQPSAYIYCGGLKITFDCNINVNGSTGNYGLLVYTDITNTTNNSGYCVRVERIMSSVNLGLYRGSSGTGNHYVYAPDPTFTGFSLNGNFSSTTIGLSSSITTSATNGITLNVSGGNFDSRGYNMTSFGSFSAGWSGAGTCTLSNSYLYGGNGISLYSSNASANIILSSTSINVATETFQVIVSSGSVTASNISCSGATLVLSGGSYSGSNTFYLNGSATIYSTSSISGSFYIYKSGSGTQNYTIQAPGVSISTQNSGDMSIEASAPLSNLSLNSSYQNRVFLIDNLSVSGSLTITGAAGSPHTVKSYSTPAKTLTSTSYNLSNINWQDITAAGTIPFTGTGFTDLGGNTNIQFLLPGSSLFFGSNF
jgi:hypothetical protein